MSGENYLDRTHLRALIQKLAPKWKIAEIIVNMVDQGVDPSAKSEATESGQKLTLNLPKGDISFPTFEVNGDDGCMYCTYTNLSAMDASISDAGDLIIIF